MSSTTGSVVAASATAVGKVFVIGLIGYLSTQFPSGSPLIPQNFVGPLARINFNLTLLPLVYTSIASSVTIEELRTLWIVPLAAGAVISISYITATLLGYIPYFRMKNSADFDALRVAASFPNIVALPILIFPSICEYPVVHEEFGRHDGKNSDEMTSHEMYAECVAKSSSMIFLYFFGFSVMFWTFGSPKLINAATKRQNQNTASLNSTQNTHTNMNTNDIAENHELGNNENSFTTEHDATNHKGEVDCNNMMIKRIMQLLSDFCSGVKIAITSPGFVAMILGATTAFIPPLKEALFEAGGSLRFFGGAVEGLGQVASVLGTIVVATSLAAHSQDMEEVDKSTNNECKPIEIRNEINSLSEDKTNSVMYSNDTKNNSHEKNSDKAAHKSDDVEAVSDVIDEKTVVTDSQKINDTKISKHDQERNIKSEISSISQNLNKKCWSMTQRLKEKKHMLKTFIWFILSRLILAPAIVCVAVVALDCSGALSNIPNLFKLVIIVNSSVPGALIIVVILKSKKELVDTASLVTQVYLPSYILSIVTIAFWTSIGLWVSIPRTDGSTICPS